MAKATKKKIELIPLEPVREIRDKVRELDKNWCENVATIMAKEDKTIDSTKVYAITTNVRRNQNDRRLFISCALKHLKKLEEEQQGILEKIKSQQ